MLNLANDVTFTGPALPDFYVQYELESALKGILPAKTQAEVSWRTIRRALRQPLTENSGAIRVRNLVLAPLTTAAGYGELTAAGNVRTREGDEPGGFLCAAVGNGARLRCWAYAHNIDLDAPIEAGLTSRYTPQRIAERVLLANGERVGLLTNGAELRLIISEAARAASALNISLLALKEYAPGDPPDALRLLLVLASPAGLAKLPDLLDDARLKQGKVTKDLRAQARAAIEGFVQGLLDHPDNQSTFQAYLQQASEGAKEQESQSLLPDLLWREALIIVYRLLFILSGEAGTRERPPFSFASTSLWRYTFSPSTALGPIAQRVMDEGAQTGHFLANGLRALFRLFEQGVTSTELTIAPLGGALFGPNTAPFVDRLQWNEWACAHLLDRLLRAPRGQGSQRSLVRLSYRDLDVEELGKVYEALLELEPGLTGEDMVRLRRNKLEVVVPAAQGEKYQPTNERVANGEWANSEQANEDDTGDDDDDDKASIGDRKSKIEWIEAIPGPGGAHPLGRFYLRVGLGRKSAGAYYTPESFVRFLVQETLGPLCDARSPEDDPQPAAILQLKILDPAMGSAHFLVGACRYLGERLWRACLRCDELGLTARIPSELQPYMPGRTVEGRSESGFSADRARAMAKRLTAVNCLYGVDKNPLAVELARVALWLESFAEGLPLTFLDHRLLCGDSLLGPLNIVGDGPNSPMTPPYAATPIDYAIGHSIRTRLREHLRLALGRVANLNATVGLDQADLERKQQLKRELDTALYPFVELCRAWSGGIMLGQPQVDETGYLAALQLLAADAWPLTDTGETDLTNPHLTPGFLKMLTKGRTAGVLVYPLTFPEVFYPDYNILQLVGFDAALGNPPWDKLRVERRDLLASLDVRFFVGKEAAGSGSEHKRIEDEFQNYPEAVAYAEEINNTRDIVRQLHSVDELAVETIEASGDIDLYRVFVLNSVLWTKSAGRVGLVLGGGFIKNPTEAPLRKYIFARSKPVLIAHYLNLRQLFHGPSTRISFCLLYSAGRDAKTDNRIFLGFGLTKFENLDISNASFALQVFDFETCANTIRNTGELISTGIEEITNNQVKFNNVLNFLTENSIEIGTDLHRTQAKPALTELRVIFPSENDARNPTLVADILQRGYAPAYSSRSIDLFNDYPREMSGKWNPAVDLLANLSHPKVLSLQGRIQYFRLTLRATCGHPKTNERSFVVCILPPGMLTTNSLLVEIRPHQRPNSSVLFICALLDTFCPDYRVRLRVQANINKGILEKVELPPISQVIQTFLTHSALRLSCNHISYAPLWQEQLSNNWREPSPPYTWPVLAGEESRWEVRAAIDTVVARAYGLNRARYEHVLRSFDRASGPNPHTAHCLAKWDELHDIGLEAFIRQYDPYWDVPLVESLPKPVIELPEITPKAEPQPGEIVQRDLFGNVVQTNLFGEVVWPSEGKRGKGKKK